MPKKKPLSFAQRLGHTVSDMANAASVAATGSQMGVLELAAEDELKPASAKRARKAKAVRKKKATAKKSSRPLKKKRGVKRR